MTQLFSSLHLLSGRKECKRKWQDFEIVAKKHGMLEKITVQEQYNGGSITWTLIPIIEAPDKKPAPLPGNFVAELINTVILPLKKVYEEQKFQFDFKISLTPMTMEQIKKAQEDWNRYCEQFWEACG